MIPSQTMTTTQNPDPPQTKRPLAVWFLSAYFLVTGLFSLISIPNLFPGVFGLFYALWMVLHLLGAVFLFRLRKTALPLFLISLVGNIITTLWLGQANFLVQRNMPILVFGWIIFSVICFYIWRLTRSGRLR